MCRKARDAASEYIRRGWAPVPIPFRKKGPVLKSWQRLRLTKADLDEHFPPDGPQRIELALGDPLWDWLQTQVPQVVERIDVARRGEEKVLNFPTARMEEIVRRVTERELVLIVRVGYLLGAFIGLALVGGGLFMG